MPKRSSAPTPPPATTPRRRGWLPAALIVIAGLMAYANSLTAPFIFDDLPNIEKNPSIKQLWSLDVFTPPRDAAGTVGRPLVNLSLALNYAVGGTNVVGYHVFNLLTHLLAGLVLFGVVRRALALPRLAGCLGVEGTKGTEGTSPLGPLGPSGPFASFDQPTLLALLTAILWVIHPLQTESVVCVIQRTEVMVGLCYLLTFYCFLRSLEPGAGGSWRFAAIVSTFIGIGCKEVMATAPVLLFLFDALFVAGSFREAWATRWRFYLGLLASWILLALLMLGSGQRSNTVGFGLGMSGWDYLLTQARAIVMYLKLVVWPNPLVLDYGYGVERSFVAVLPQFLLLVALVLATAWAVWRRLALGFIGAWFFLILGPSSSIVPLTTQTIAEHRMYLPLAGVLVLLVTGLHRWLGRHALWATGALGLLFVALTLSRNHDYRSALALWSDTATKAWTNARAQTNWGNALVRSNRRPEAIPHFERAIQLDRTYSEAHHNLGLALVQEGRPADSLPHFENALKLRPYDADARRNYAGALALLNRLPEALTHFEAAAKLKPEHAEGLGLYGWALLSNSRALDAIPPLEKSVRLEPNVYNTRLDLANALAALGRPQDALPHYQAAAQLNAGDATLFYNWGLALMKLGRAAEAVPRFEVVVRLRPNDTVTRDILARARQAAGIR
jgi:tetratricopeptide (TPR) repeat protein